MTAADRPPPPWLPWLPVVAATVVATALRVRLVLAGPDVDTDAFAHAVIARRMFSEWRDVTIHWVWLPLWHLVGFAAAALGDDLVLQRWLSVTLAGLAPLLLTALLRARDRASPAPFIAGMLFALWPLHVVMGAAGEPEAAFQFLVLAACFTWERKHPVATGAILGAAALLRYEAWVLPAVFFALWLARGRARRDAWAWLVPGATIAAWVLLHRALTGEWFWFIRENHRYIAQAWRDQAIVATRPPSLRYAPVWYLALVPWLSVGRALWFAPLGLPWALRRAPRSLVATGLTLLAFVTAVWVARTNLGLKRHFVVLVPLYAALIAAGMTAVARAVAARLRRPWVEAVLAWALYLLALRDVARGPLPFQIRQTTEISRGLYGQERAVAAAVRANLADRTRVFCDVCDGQRLEVFLRLPPWRFVRWHATDVSDFTLLVESAQRGRALVLSAPERVTQLRQGVRVLYRDASLVVLRRDAPAVIAPWLVAMPAAR